jgi:hypothetical protein
MGAARVHGSGSGLVTTATAITRPERSRPSRSGRRRCYHNVLLLGPPGAGKSMLARRLTTILPAMTLAEAIETTRIHHVAGLTGDRTALVTIRPCRAPPQTISVVRLIGEGPQPLAEGCREDSSQALCGSNSYSPHPRTPAR